MTCRAYPKDSKFAAQLSKNLEAGDDCAR